MKSHAQVVVIGGGVVGCSVLFHLAKHGWTDVVLVERDELTSGSTWHAAGGMHTINGDPNVAKLQKYTIELYKEIEELSGQATGVHITGGVLLAATRSANGLAARPRRQGPLSRPRSGGDLGEGSCRADAAAGRQAIRRRGPQYGGRPSRSVRRHPCLCQGSAHARRRGLSLHQASTDLVRREDGMWRVVTDKGEIVAEHVVNAGGLWAREVGRTVGLELPVLAMEHMYLITEDMPEVAAWNAKTGAEIMHAVDFDGELYLRQERGGMLMGTYEKASKPWSEHQTPWNFGHELLEPDIERIAPSLEVGFRHFPAFQKHRHQRRSSTGLSPSRRTATRWSGRCAACRASGSHAASWPAFQPGRRRRPGARQLDDRLATPAPTSGHGCRPLTATGRRWPTPTPRCARTIRAASPSAFRTRNCRGPAAADHADLRPALGEGRAVGRRFRARGAALVRAGRRERRVLLAALDRFRACRARGAEPFASASG